jgi:hypothetical protein
MGVRRFVQFPPLGAVDSFSGGVGRRTIGPGAPSGSLKQRHAVAGRGRAAPVSWPLTPQGTTRKRPPCSVQPSPPTFPSGRPFSKREWIVSLPRAHDEGLTKCGLLGETTSSCRLSPDSLTTQLMLLCVSGDDNNDVSPRATPTRPSNPCRLPMSREMRSSVPRLLPQRHNHAFGQAKLEPTSSQPARCRRAFRTSEDLRARASICTLRLVYPCTLRTSSLYPRRGTYRTRG